METNSIARVEALYSTVRSALLATFDHALESKARALTTLSGPGRTDINDDLRRFL